MNLLHITLTPFKNESRILKEINSLAGSGSFGKVYVVASQKLDLPKIERIGSRIVVLRFSLFSNFLPSHKCFQMIKFLEFCGRIVLFSVRRRVEVTSVHSVVLLPLGWVQKKFVGSRLVYDAHELETERNGLSRPLKIICKFVESRCVSSCDLIVVVGEEIARWYRSKYNISKMIVVKNAPRTIPYIDSDLLRKKLGIPSEKKILLYQGGLGSGRGIGLILDAFRSKDIRSDIIVVFLGYGSNASLIHKYSLESENIWYLPAVSPEVVHNYTCSADIGLSIIENTCLSYYYCLPNKLFEYAMAGLPVIVSNMKEMAANVREGDFGIVIEQFSTESLLTAIDLILASDLNEMSAKARLFADTNSWSVQEKILLDAYNEMLVK